LRNTVESVEESLHEHELFRLRRLFDAFVLLECLVTSSRVSPYVLNSAVQAFPSSVDVWHFAHRNFFTFRAQYQVGSGSGGFTGGTKRTISRRRKENSTFTSSLGAPCSGPLQHNFEPVSFQTDDLASQERELDVHVFARGRSSTTSNPRASKRMISRRRKESSAFFTQGALGHSFDASFQTDNLASQEGKLGVYVFAWGLRRNFESTRFQTDDLASEDGELGVHVFARDLRRNFDRLIGPAPRARLVEK
jgi:hypothetical protein